jgi:predicted dehydrogenase
MSPDAPLRFAIVGCGTIAPTHAKALLALPGAELTVCCDIDRPRAEKLAADFSGIPMGWPEVLSRPDVDAVSLCTPSGCHADQAVAALHTGKHVIIEKPMDITTTACEQIIHAQKTSGKQVSVISQHRFDPVSRELKALLQRNDLGTVFSINARIPWYRTQEYYDSGEWRGTWKMDGGGALMNQGIHTLDLILWMGGPVQSVFARAKTAAHERIEVEDHLCATLQFSSGAIGTLVASTATYPGFPVRIDITGTSGTFIIEGDDLHTVAIKDQPVRHGRAHPHALQMAHGGTREATNQSVNNVAGDPWVWGDAHRAQLADFIEACRTNRPPAISAADGLASIRTIESIYQSARTGQVVVLR